MVIQHKDWSSVRKLTGKCKPLSRNEKMTFRTIAITLAVLFPLTSSALGELDNLQGSKILVSGQIDSVPCPLSGKYDCISWPQDLYEMSLKSICFTSSFNCALGCEGFIAEKNGVMTAYSIGKGFGSPLSAGNVTVFKCPSKY